MYHWDEFVNISFSNGAIPFNKLGDKDYITVKNNRISYLREENRLQITIYINMYNNMKHITVSDNCKSCEFIEVYSDYNRKELMYIIYEDNSISALITPKMNKITLTKDNKHIEGKFDDPNFTLVNYMSCIYLQEKVKQLLK